jgi:uncharacterized membrane protein YphA (DoxX/SURF4 family)
LSFSEYISPLIGRVLLGLFFLSQALTFGSAWDANVHLLASKAIPEPPLMLALGVLVLFLGGLSLILGFATRLGALLLFACVIGASIKLHDYWRIHDTALRAAEFSTFAMLMAVAGGLLILVGMGPGPVAIDSAGSGGHD